MHENPGMKKLLTTVVFFTLLWGCKKTEKPLQAGTITYYHEVNGKIVSVIDIPSAFTPNGDGVNDYFGPVLRGCHDEGFGLTVFNRSNETIFVTTNMSNAWDGTSNGIKSAEGTYRYQVLARDTTGYAYQISYSFRLLR